MSKWFSRRLASRLPLSNLPNAKSPGNSKPGKGRGRGSGAQGVVGTAWDPAKKGTGVTLSNNNYTVTASGASAYAASVVSKNAGKYYLEMRIDDDGFSSNSPYFGVCNYATYNKAVPSLNSTGVWVCSFSNGGGFWIQRNGTFVNTWQATVFATGDVINLAIDIDAGKMFYGKNGTWINSGNPDAGTGAVISTSMPGTGTDLNLLTWQTGSPAWSTLRTQSTDWGYARPQASSFGVWGI